MLSITTAIVADSNSTSFFYHPIKSITEQLAKLTYKFYDKNQWFENIWMMIDKPIQKETDPWGPKPPLYSPPIIPKDVNQIKWKRQRVVEVAKKLIGLPYKHHHDPEWEGPNGRGIDCSNFTTWIYNYGLGIKFSSDIDKQAEGRWAAGRRLLPSEPFMPGDLLFMTNKTKDKYTHVVMYIGNNKIIDVQGKGGVQIRKFKGWYKRRFIFARRVIE